ncbi:hypothetical protein AHF37_09932 [Paragonimus kellicotti]|nr:hypothetical protein AHF37_09932 [Paragonimus kellicotti]
MSNVNAMWEMGLFLNDLCMHDSSREMVLAGEQQAAELKLALEQVRLMSNVNAMWEMGLFLNDLCMHDSSREMVLAGEQQAAELKLALEQVRLFCMFPSESEKSKRLEESLRRLDEEMKRTDELLYQMIPKAVAQRLRSGEPAIDTCEVIFPRVY